MKLGLNLGHVRSRQELATMVELAGEADRCGYAVLWVSEAYGSDAVSVLGHLSATTRSIDLGAAVMQIPARTPAMTAMTAATLDLLSEGRFRLGLGVSGPQVSEGWHGVRFRSPLARSREYLDVVRRALQRELLVNDGEFYPLPLPDGPGKPLRLSVRAQRDQVPVYLAAVGPKNLELAGEVADGWLSMFFSAEHAVEVLSPIRAGRASAGLDMDGFDVNASVPVLFGDDLQACADQLRPHVALYVGGMGSREQNFYNGLARRMGYEETATVVQDLYLAGDKDGAAAALPFELIDQLCLLGPVDRVADRMRAFAECGVTTLSIGSTTGEELSPALLRAAADALETSGSA